MRRSASETENEEAESNEEDRSARSSANGELPRGRTTQVGEPTKRPAMDNVPKSRSAGCRSLRIQRGVQPFGSLFAFALMQLTSVKCFSMCCSVLAAHSPTLIARQQTCRVPSLILSILQQASHLPERRAPFIAERSLNCNFLFRGTNIRFFPGALSTRPSSCPLFSFFCRFHPRVARQSHRPERALGPVCLAQGATLQRECEARKGRATRGAALLLYVQGVKKDTFCSCQTLAQKRRFRAFCAGRTRVPCVPGTHVLVEALSALASLAASRRFRCSHLPRGSGRST